MKLVFCGTPSFAVPTLKSVVRAGHEVALVVTQPDRPVGRGQQLAAPAVKVTALDAGLPVVQPEKIKKNEEFRAQLETIAPDAILVVAYGRIIPKWMLDLPRYGNLNLHGSLLPKYRGAAPIQWAIANGEPVTGATTMHLDEGLDTGDILLQRGMSIAPSMTSEDIFPLLSEMGADLMLETLAGLSAGTIERRPQDHALATPAPILTRDDGRIDFSQPAMTIYNRWRGFQPWPGAWTTLQGKKLTVHRMLPTEVSGASAGPGGLHQNGDRLFAACEGKTWVELVEIQLEGKKRMAAADFLRGRALESGTKLGES
ncbi:methionyl-tRNA formyltransferase [Paracidobacterium acidisoli]|uniref:Methionyl-tRNA formyltransferase n=1 Tax=Paracidobacterium acidisoli TaxID=2303751 RepID=A0A372ILG7_9BACT|nr:methionyl-tRNA formyltransferase [Paracidobacterium acidisoli]MBT9332857.1 methionyl-tRNA formyltransferase [Paracidobacterium acidisoli]